MQEYLNEAQEMMEMAILHVEDELARIRAGKANTRILDGIRSASTCRWNAVITVLTFRCYGRAIGTRLFRILHWRLFSLGLQERTESDTLRHLSCVMS